MRIRFNLKNRRAERSLVLLKLVLPGSSRQFTWSTGEHVRTEDWDDRHHRLRARAREAMWLNALLNRIEAEAYNCIRQHMVDHDRPPTAAELRNHLNKQFRASVQMGVLDYFDSFIERMAGNGKSSYHTVKMFKVARNNMAKFVADSGRELSWQALSREWFEEWEAWNFRNGRNNNSVAGYLKKIKAVLNAARDEGYLKQDIKFKGLTTTFTRSDEVFLTVDELMLLYRTDGLGPNEEIVRDLFLLDAFSGGFRFEDLMNLKRENIVPINNVRAIKMHTRKTDSLVYAPASWYLDEFLAKYHGKQIASFTNQHFNRTIKQVCRKAGICQPVELRKNRGGRDEYITKPKWQWVTQYTARYSFATNLFLAGVPLKQISVLLGHSSVKITESYIKASELATVIALSDNPYFSRKPG